MNPSNQPAPPFPLPVPTLSQLGPLLQGRRKALGLTQKEAAKKTGLLPKTISALENNPAGSSLDSLFSLLSALDMELLLQDKQAAPLTPPQPSSAYQEDW